MADAKISQLPVATTPLAGTELVPVVQGGVTDQTTVEAILTGTVPSGTANGVLYLDGSKVVTSGSALTFDGSTLIAGAAASRIQVSPSTNTNTSLFQATNNGGSGYVGLDSSTGNLSGEAYALTLWHNSNYPIVFGVNNNEQMRLNSTGLGIGTNNPGAKLDVVGTIKATATQSQVWNGATGTYTTWQYNGTSVGDAGAGNQAISGGGTGDFAISSRSGNLVLGTGSSARATIDSSGNLGLGVTPSAWGSFIPLAIELPNGVGFASQSNAPVAHFSANAYYDGSWRYKANGVAARYALGPDTHSWFTAPSGTAGNTISFTQAMTLTAGGDLGIGTNNPAARVHAMSSSSSLSFGLSPSNSNTNIGYVTNDSTYIMFASGYGANGQKFRVALQAPDNSATLDSSGNLGLGVTPSGWGANYRAIDFFGGYTSVFGANNFSGVAHNYYNDNVTNRYKTNGFASLYGQTDGKHIWYTAPSGNAGDPISFTQAMTLDASGRLGIGTTSPVTTGGSLFEISNSVNCLATITCTNDTTSLLDFRTNSVDRLQIQSSSNWGAYFLVRSNQDIKFGTNNTERARIPAAGGMVVGTAALATTATDGFLYVPTCAGTPTGTPTTQTGTAPIVVDTTNNKLYFYSGGQWRDAGP